MLYKAIFIDLSELITDINIDLKILYFILFAFLFTSFTQLDTKAPRYDIYIFLHDECIISQYYTIPLAELDETFHDIATFYGVFPNPQMTQERLEKFKQDYKLKFKLILDPDFELVNKFEATVTPEVMVIDNLSKEVIYSGRIDNAYARVGKKRTIVTEHELKQVLTALRNNTAVQVESKPAIGCIITQVKTK